jgi:hypothetical protein
LRGGQREEVKDMEKNGKTERRKGRQREDWERREMKGKA